MEPNEFINTSYLNLSSVLNKSGGKGENALFTNLKYGQKIQKEDEFIKYFHSKDKNIEFGFGNIVTSSAVRICNEFYEIFPNLIKSQLSIQELFDMPIDNTSICFFDFDFFKKKNRVDIQHYNLKKDSYILVMIKTENIYNMAFLDDVYQVKNGELTKNYDDEKIREVHDLISDYYKYALWTKVPNDEVIEWKQQQYLLMNIDTDIHEYFNDEQKRKIERPLNVNYEANNKTVQYGNIVGNNLIFYGAPGTGKSYGIQKYIQDDLGFKKIDVKSSNNVFRTTFHPEYGYSDFVGQIMPTVNEKGQLKYIFNPGSFTQALVYAYRHPNEPVFLILEEMSRANCASVFGDIFQLLDRNEQGESEYPINHLQLSNYLYKKLGKSHSWDKYKSKIYIPRNLYLIGTMNTSDQNVFVMDTAFKRRFLMKYVPTTIDSNKNQFSLPYSDTETMEWNDFVKTVNDYIVDDKGLQLSEDKQLGQFFMKGKNQKGNDDSIQEESTPYFAKNFETYKDKVLYYLYHDVEKASYHTEKRLFNENIKSFGDLYQKATEKNHYDIYSKEFKDCLEKNMHSTKDVSYNMDNEIEENE